MPEEHFFSTNYAEPMVIWPKGYYTDGAEIISNAMDIIRREIERQDCPQGFQLFNSLSGGFGSGFSGLLLLKIRIIFHGYTFCYNIYPSTNKSATNLCSHHYNFAVYNSVLALHQNDENSDFCYVLDNDKFLNIAQNQCKLKNPTYDDINWLISQILSGVTSTLRFHTEPQTNITLRAFGVSMISQWRLKFFTLSHSPFYAKHDYKYNSNINGIIQNLLTNDVSNVELKNGNY